MSTLNYKLISLENKSSNGPREDYVVPTPWAVRFARRLIEDKISHANPNKVASVYANSRDGLIAETLKLYSDLSPISFAATVEAVRRCNPKDLKKIIEVAPVINNNLVYLIIKKARPEDVYGLYVQCENRLRSGKDAMPESHQRMALAKMPVDRVMNFIIGIKNPTDRLLKDAFSILSQANPDKELSFEALIMIIKGTEAEL